MTRPLRTTRSHLTLLLLLITACPTPFHAQAVWFEDSFLRSSFGSSWRPSTPEWRIDSGRVSIKTTDYDQLLASSFYVYNTQPYSIEVTLKGMRSGIYFSLDDTSTKALSHMVRFDEKSILTGFFNAAGEFTATNTFDVPRLPTEWTNLRIDINPKQRTYEVFVDGISVGVDTRLVFPSGYCGLQASDGLSQFKSMKIAGNGKAKKPSNPRKGNKITFQHVSFVKAEQKNVVIFNPELRCWQTLNPDGKLIKQVSVRQQPPRTVQAAAGNRLFSIKGKKVYVADKKGSIVDSICRTLVAPWTILVDDRTSPPTLLVVDAGINSVFRFDLQGKPLETVDGRSIGGFKALRGIDLYGETGLVLADYDKLVFYNPRTDSVAPKILVTSATEVSVSWLSSARLHSFVEYAPDGGSWKTINRVSVHPGGRRTATVRNLSPLSRYSIRVSPTLTIIPEEYAHSTIYRIATPPADSIMMPLTRLPLLCMVYRTISYRDVYPQDRYPQIPNGRTITDDEIVYLKNATDFNRDFYFRNSSCKFVLDFDFFVVEDTLWLHEVGDQDPYWLGPNDRVAKDYERAARYFGKKPEDYAGLICPYAWLNYPPRRTRALRDPLKGDTVNIRQAYGGGTNGIPAPWKYGKTAGYTSNPFQDNFSRQDWLITHEFHHQLDALMDVSGYPEYYHADIPWKMPGQFGEDFDFNAQIMRNAPLGSWLGLKFGRLTRTKDADHDGVPDDDPSLPFDEKRLHGNPLSRDTDGDGLDDLQEVMAGSSKGTALDNKDTDADGLIDGTDPEPLYPSNPMITKLARPEELQSVVFATIASNELQGSAYLRWDDRYLYFKTNTDKPANVLIQIDADNDGWFHGFDNTQIRVMNNGDSSWVADYYLRDCSSWTDSPKDRRDILKKTDLPISSTVSTELNPADRKVYSLTVRVPRHDAFRLDLKQGKNMSVRFGLQTKTDLWVWDELFQRNYMMPIELQ